MNRVSTQTSRLGAVPEETRPVVLLIRGCPRSGTTLLVDILNQNRDVAVLDEYALGDLVRDLSGILAFEREKEKLVALRSRSADVIGDPDLPGVYVPPHENGFVHREVRYPTVDRFAMIVTAVIAAALDRTELRIVGSKTPGAVDNRERARLERYFPHIRYVFTVRNPLDTINSIINRRNASRAGWDQWNFETVQDAVREYRESVTILFAHVMAYPDDCFVVGYEDLVHRYAATGEQLGAFLGVAIACHPGIVEADRFRKLVLTEEERAFVDAELGAEIDAWGKRVTTGRGSTLLGSLIGALDVMDPGELYSYSREAGSRRFLGLGWDQLEELGIWSNAPRSGLIFRVDRDGEYVLQLQLSFFLPTLDSTVSATIAVDGTRVFEAIFYHPDRVIIDATAVTPKQYRGIARTEIRLGPVHLSARAAHSVQFDFGDLPAADELGVEGDDRRLAIALHGVSLFVAARR